jgi:hypothetical protein
LLPIDYYCAPLSLSRLRQIACLSPGRQARRMTRCCHCEEPQGTTKLVRANRAGLHPGVEQRTCLHLRARRGAAIAAGRPGPTNQVIVADMMHDLVRRAAAVARRIFDLRANLPDRLAFPCHVTRREMPGGIARHARRFEICPLMANLAAHRWQPKAVCAALDRRLMQAAPCGSISAEIRCLSHVRSAPNNGLKSDIAASRFRANTGSRCSHSITSSAATRSAGGTLRPRAFAVFKFRIVSNFVGACNGRSAGFSPLRMRSM